jgi:hypothetical protein
VPSKPALSEYLAYADRLLTEWHKAHEAWEASPFSAELGRQKSELDRVVSDFAETFRSRYGVKNVEQDPAFWPVSRFFSERRPVVEPFSILHCDLEMPLHTVLAFSSQEDLARLDAALEERTPLRWWRSGPGGLACYLFGQSVWEIKASEAAMSESGLALTFIEASERDRQRRDRLIRASSPAEAASTDAFVPEKTRALVWRRARGRCEKCRGLEGLDFSLLDVASRGKDPAPQNVQLLCTRCRG